MEAKGAEGVEKEMDVTEESSIDNLRERMVLEVESRQQVLMQNLVICEHMLNQLQQLRSRVVDPQTPQTESKSPNQPESENVAQVQSDEQDPTPKVVPGAE